MKDRVDFLFPKNSVDGVVIPIQPWIPPKTLAEEFKGFKIFKSSPTESPSGTIQLAIVHPNIDGEMFRVDSYREGYFGADWLSTVELPEFLSTAERYFQEFEDQFSGEVHGTMGVFTYWRSPEFWEFGRPLAMDDFGKEDAFIGDENHQLSLLRLDTPPGDLCYQPEDEKVGILAYLDQGAERHIIEAVARLVTRTQSLLPEDVVTRTIELLPYKRVPIKS